MPCRTDTVRDNREAHSYLLRPFDRKQRFSRTGRNTGHVLTEIARHVIRKNYGGPVLRMERNRPVWTDLGTVAALGASIQKQRLVSRAWRAQPIGSHREWSRLFRRGMLVFGKLLCRSGNGHHRVFEEVATPIARIGGHNDAPVT